MAMGPSFSSWSIMGFSSGSSFMPFMADST